MVDRVSASIRIGGTMTTDQLDTLVTLAASYPLATEWDGEPAERGHFVDGTAIELYAHEVAWGVFDALETWLVDNRLPFVRECDGCNGAFGAERVVYRGSGVRAYFGMDEAGLIVVDSETVLALASYDAILDHFASADFDPGPLRIVDRYALPGGFIRDCVECDCDIGDYADGVLSASAAQVQELRHRASQYVDPNAPDAAPVGLKTAAHALLRALDRTRVPVALIGQNVATA